MPSIPIDPKVLVEFADITRTALRSPNRFHEDIGWRRYDGLARKLLTDAGVIPPDPWISPPALKAIIARCALERTASGHVTQKRVAHALREVVADIRRGQGSPGVPDYQTWVAWVILPVPTGPITGQFIEGSGILRWPQHQCEMRLSTVGQRHLEIAGILDGPIDNRAGAPVFKDYEGTWCLEYRYWGTEQGVWEPFQRWMNVATLWAQHPPQWAVAFRYSLSMAAKDYTEMHKNYPDRPPGRIPVMAPDPTISALDRRFQNLWPFVNWVGHRLTQLPGDDVHRISVAFETFHLASTNSSGALFVTLSVMLAEALLGSDRELSRTVSQRVAWVLEGRGSVDDRDVRFREEKLLYDLRSRIVHGQVSSSGLYEAYQKMTKNAGLETVAANLLARRIADRNRLLVVEALRIKRDSALAHWADRRLMT